MMTRGPRLVLLGCALVLALAGEVRALPAEPRWAIVIGNNTGLASDTPLRFAERDAARIEAALVAVGGFSQERVFRVTGGDAGRARATLAAIEVGLVAAGEPDALLFVFYSGHADASALHLAGTTWAIDELQRWVLRSKAQTRVMVIDACRSGAVTRVKGGVQGPSFEIALDDRMAAEGSAILASTAAGEDALESDELQASYFTHHFVSALHGAADVDGDGRVTVSEAFQYASVHTLESTASTMAGPQHPTYRLELGGRHELVLSRPGLIGKRLSVVELPEAGTWIFRRGDRERLVVGEVVAAAPGKRLTLEPGAYRVTLRTATAIRETVFVIAAGQTMTIDVATMQRRRVTREASKGARAITSPSLARRFLESERESEGADVAPSPATPAPVVEREAPRREVESGPPELWLGLGGGVVGGGGDGASLELTLGGALAAGDGLAPIWGSSLTIDDQRGGLFGISAMVGARAGGSARLGLEARIGLGLLGGDAGLRVEGLVAFEPLLAERVALRVALGAGIVTLGDGGELGLVRGTIGVSLGL